MTNVAKRWTIVLSRDAKRSLDRLPRNLSERLGRAINTLALNPRPVNCIQLTGFKGRYRIRIGDWRIIYNIQDDELIVLIIKVKPRGDVYRD